MYGFIGCFGDEKILSTNSNIKDKAVNYVRGEIRSKSLLVRRKTIDKFIDDKLFFESDNLVFCIEGVIYNFEELREKNEDRQRMLERLYRLYAGDMIKKLKGNFSMMLFDKLNEKLYLFSDHISFRPIYYYDDNHTILFSTDLAWLYDSLEKNHLKKELDADAAFSLLSHGYMLGEQTLERNTKKILAGQYIEFTQNSRKCKNYFSFSAQEITDLSSDRLLDIADKKFSEAIKRIYEKDREYGYKHVCTISGGLDSRSILFVSNSLGYKEQVAITMAESNTLDFKIAAQICRDLNIEHIFYALDTGKHLYCLDEAIEGNGGTITYQGFTHILRLFELVALNNYGAIHTGGIGDMIFGGHNIIEYERKPEITDGAFSKRLVGEISKEFKEEVLSRCKSSFEFIFCNRALNSAVNGSFASNYYTESSSAFLDKDFLEFMLEVPAKYKADSKFYIQWMKKCHPEMCQYKWEKYNALTTAGKVGRFVGGAGRKLQRDLLKKNFSMNPYALWYEKYEGIRKMYDEIYDSNISLITNDRIKKNIELLWGGTITEKMQIITLLKAVERYNIT